MKNSFTETVIILGGMWLGLPPSAAALLVLLLGLLLGLIIRRLIGQVLETAWFNALCTKAGIVEFLRKGNVHHSPGHLVALLTSWAIILLAVLGALHLVGLELVATLGMRMEAALPALITAICVLVLGYATVAFSANVIRTLARNAGSPYADVFGNTIKWIGVFIIMGVAVEQVGIETKFISAVLQIILAAVSFGLALAFGLGCKDLAREAMQRFIQALRERHRHTTSDLEG